MCLRIQKIWKYVYGLFLKRTSLIPHNHCIKRRHINQDFTKSVQYECYKDLKCEEESCSIFIISQQWLYMCYKYKTFFKVQNVRGFSKHLKKIQPSSTQIRVLEGWDSHKYTAYLTTSNKANGKNNTTWIKTSTKYEENKN